MPLYYILFLAIVRMFIKETIYEAIPTEHDGALLQYDNNYLVTGNVFVTPETDVVKSVISNLNQFIDFSPDRVFYFSSEDDMLDNYLAEGNVSVGLVFTEDPITNPVYKIRINPRMTYLVPPSTLLTKGSQCRGVNITGLESEISCPPNSYFHSGFLTLQTAIDSTLTQLRTNSTVVPMKVALQSFPLSESTSGGALVLRSLVPLYMVFAWSQFILYMMILIVDEKEKKIKEGMKMMGLRGSVYWLSWVTIYFCYVILLAIICIIVLPLAKVFRYANLFLLFILFVLYGLSSIILALMLTPFFDKAKMAGIVGQLIQVMMSLLFYLQVYLSDKISTTTFWFLGLLSPCAFSLAIDKVILFDFSEGGLNWDNIWEGDGLPFAGSLIMISLDIFLYLALAFYFDNVIPSDFGTKRKPWFIFQKSTWVKSKDYSQMTERVPFVPTGLPNQTFVSDAEGSNPDIEPFPSEWKGREAVRIRNLHKVFKSKGKEDLHAVDGISMDIYEGQITAILGHNGAGKTTLFNMLTGMISPSKGWASIFNLDICDLNDLAEIRQLTGVCPQHDILFLNLTPKEHLTFYARIKGIDSQLIEGQVAQMLLDIDLTSKANTKANDLSGGQKRKLSIGIALIGDPKILFLDEPTAGVDAYSRRHLWALLKKKKKGKVILLTTHFMDEADILADRKAVVSKGKLRCYGTSLFLKNKFGLGYHLTLVISESREAPETSERLVKEVIPQAELARHYGKELSFILPSASSTKFSPLFCALDSNIADAGGSQVESYGISMTTLEEVFLALNEESEKDEIGSMENLSRQLIRARSPSLTSPSQHSSPSSPSHLSSSLPPQPNGALPAPEHNATLPKQQEGFRFDEVRVEKDKWRAFRALVKLRITNLRRELNAVFFLVVFPLVLVVASIALANSVTVKFADDDLILLNTDLYSSMENNVLVDNETSHDLSLFQSTLADFDLVPSLYDGNYSIIYHDWPHFSAFDVFQFSGDSFNVRIRFNNSFSHSLPILMNVINNAVLRSLSPSGDDVSTTNDSLLKVYSQQLPLLESGVSEFDVGAFFSPVMIGFVFTIIPAGLVIDIVYDREINGRNLLRLNGVGFNLYFSSFLLVMMLLYLFSYFSLLIIIQAFQVPALVVPPGFATLALLYLIYMPSALLFSGCCSYAFDKQETARQFYPSIVTTFGFICYTAIVILDLLQGTQTSRPLHMVFTALVPYYIPFGALYYVNKVYVSCDLLNACGDITMADYMTPEIVVMLVFCVVDAFVFYVLLKVVDVIKAGGHVRDVFGMKAAPPSYNRIKPDCPPSPAEDEDVKEERERILAKLNNSETDSPAMLYDVGKTYEKGGVSNPKSCLSKEKSSTRMTAVKSVSFEVRPGEVFGLLGPNGAGKTSTIKMMTAEEGPSKGQLMVCGCNINSNLSSAYEYLGYCPQFDCQWKNTTLDEHIECFANISGVKVDQIEGLTDAYIKGLEIEEHRGKMSKNCSGGTKRKLNYILSMLGSPKIVLLDEPSSGMDPQSKRFLWNSILASFKGDRSSLLTTHSMEEADALCSRIGILVKGELRCLGSVQHLKNKYGNGYNLEIKLRKATDPNFYSSNNAAARPLLPSEELASDIKRTIRDMYPNSSIDEEFEERIIFKIPQRDMNSLSLVFEMLESLKEGGKIEDYALCQTSLEQVFLRFARLQEEEEEEEEEKAAGRKSSPALP